MSKFEVQEVDLVANFSSEEIEALVRDANSFLSVAFHRASERTPGPVRVAEIPYVPKVMFVGRLSTNGLSTAQATLGWNRFIEASNSRLAFERDSDVGANRLFSYFPEIYAKFPGTIATANVKLQDYTLKVPVIATATIPDAVGWAEANIDSLPGEESALEAWRRASELFADNQLKF